MIMNISWNELDVDMLEIFFSLVLVQLESTSFELTLCGRAHENKLEDPDNQHDDKPTKKVITQVVGPG